MLRELVKGHDFPWKHILHCIALYCLAQEDNVFKLSMTAMFCHCKKVANPLFLIITLFCSLYGVLIYVNNTVNKAVFWICKWPHETPQNMQNFIASVLWREEGYTMKNSLRQREIPGAMSEVFCKGSGNIWSYIPTWITIQTFSITTSALTFLGDQYWKSWFSVLLRQLANAGKYWPID